MSRFLNSIVREDEVVRQIVRANPIRYWPAITFSLLLVIGPFFFLYVLLQYRFWGLAVFGLILAGGTFSSFRTWFLWHRNMFIVTDQRLIDADQKSLFHRVVSEVPFNNIQDVSFAIKGILATIFQFGTLIVQTASNNETIEFRGIRHPEKLQSAIVKFQSEYLKRQSKRNDVRTDEFYFEGRKALQELIKLWGKDKFKEIVKEMTTKE